MVLREEMQKMASAVREDKVHEHVCRIREAVCSQIKNAADNGHYWMLIPFKSNEGVADMAGNIVREELAAHGFTVYPQPGIPTDRYSTMFYRVEWGKYEASCDEKGMEMGKLKDVHVAVETIAEVPYRKTAEYIKEMPDGTFRIHRPAFLPVLTAAHSSEIGEEIPTCAQGEKDEQTRD